MSTKSMDACAEISRAIGKLLNEDGYDKADVLTGAIMATSMFGMVSGIGDDEENAVNLTRAFAEGCAGYNDILLEFGEHAIEGLRKAMDD